MALPKSQQMRRFLLATAGLSMVFAGQAGRAADANDAARRPQRPAAVSFPHTRSDILPDPAAHFGRLKNGMTYIIYKNKTPPGAADIFLRFGVGSVMEQDDQRGLAHFLEHMAFNGSKNVPQGDMVKTLERDGLAFGADTNASTSYDQTVYTLNVTKATDKTIDDCLFLLREVGGNLSLDPGAIDRQRGVVLSEERLRSSPDVRANEAFMRTLLPAEKMTYRNPIGLVDIIKNAPPSSIRDFYRDFYRPEYATLVVVGDVDVDQIEAKIKAKFSDWAPEPQSGNAIVDYGTVRPAALSAFTYAEPGLKNAISVVWTKPSEDKVRTHKVYYEDMLRAIAFSILGQRLSRQSDQEDAAFLTANLSRDKMKNTATVTSLDIKPKPHREAEAIDQTITTMRQFVKYGVSQEELDRMLIIYDTWYRDAVKSGQTRLSGYIASQIMGSLGQNDVLTSPQQDMLLYTQTKPRLTLDAVNAYIKHYDFGYGPMVYRQADDVSDFGKDALLASYSAAMAKPIVAPPLYHVKAWPYQDFGAPGKVVARAPIAGLDGTRLTFANGIKLNFKHTDLARNSIDVTVRFDGGMLLVPPTDAVTVQAAAAMGLISGGLGKLRREDIPPALTGKSIGASAYIGEDSVGLSGSTTPDSFATQLQYLMAFATDPAFSPIAWEEVKGRLPELYKSRMIDPNGVFAMKGRPFLHGGDPRFGIAPLADMVKVTRDDIRATWLRLMHDTPIEITIVGDISEEAAVRQVAATFGTLADRPATVTPAPGADAVRFPARDLHQIYTDTGRPDKNLSYLAWPTTDLYQNMQDASGLELLSGIMTSRLLLEVREKQGATYGISARNAPSDVFKGYGVLSVSATVKPELDSVFYASVMKIVEDLKTKPVTEDELLRARQPAIDRIDTFRQYNFYYTRALSGSTVQPQKLEAAQTEKARLMKVTIKDIQDLAKKYLDVDRAARIQVRAISTSGGNADPH